MIDPENKIVQLCAQGMSMEGDQPEAKKLFSNAWNQASTALEKFIAAHYLARHQEDPSQKLEWDKISLRFALQIGSEDIKAYYPSLYLNIAKCYEDLKKFNLAKKNYQLAHKYSGYLARDGYGDFIRRRISRGLRESS